MFKKPNINQDNCNLCFLKRKKIMKNKLQDLISFLTVRFAFKQKQI